MVLDFVVIKVHACLKMPNLDLYVFTDDDSFDITFLKKTPHCNQIWYLSKYDTVVAQQCVYSPSGLPILPQQIYGPLYPCIILLFIPAVVYLAVVCPFIGILEASVNIKLSYTSWLANKLAADHMDPDYMATPTAGRTWQGCHEGIITWTRFLHYGPFVRGIYWWVWSPWLHLHVMHVLSIGMNDVSLISGSNFIGESFNSIELLNLLFHFFCNSKFK